MTQGRSRTWPVVAVLSFGLAMAGLGIGGVADLMDSLGARAASGGSSTASGPRAAATPGSGGGAVPGVGRLSAADVVPPAVTPDPDALPGGAPAAKNDASTGPSFRPNLIILPSGRSAVVRPAGVHADGSMVVPELPSEVGWWTGGAYAGDPYGGVVLAGHVDSRQYGVGALAEMLDARRGMVLAVGNGRGLTLRYRITSVTKIPQARLAAGTDIFSQNVAHRLVVITCGGPFDRTRHRYLDNVVVIATPIR